MNEPLPLMAGMRGLTFDAGGTLIEPWPSVGHVYAEVAASFGLAGIEPAALNRQFARAWSARRNFDHSRAAWRDLVNQTFAGLCPAPPAAACFDAIYAQFGQAGAWRAFDDVLPTLTALKARGVKLGVVSNWDERLRPLLEELRLLDYFDAVAISSEVGRLKPAGEIFHRAAERLGLPPASVMHIGDSAAEDFAGARAAGLQALVLNRRASESGARSIPTLELLTK